MKKKFFFLSLYFFPTFSALNSFAQKVLMEYDFNNYNGNINSIANGWIISWNTNSSFYSSAAFSGSSGPNSYKFGNDNATVITPQFQNADTVSFWIKGSSNIDTFSTLIIAETEDGNNWDTIVRMTSLPTSARLVKYKVSFRAVQLKFIYQKSAGNLAFDDFKLVQNKQVIADFSAQFVCSGDTAFFNDLSVTGVNTTIKEWFWDFGDDSTSNDQDPKHFYAATGTYTVKLVTTDNLHFKDSSTQAFSVYGRPIADFIQSASEICQNKGLNFENISANPSDGIIDSWTWNFGDNSPLNADDWDPLHFFIDSGTFLPQLIVYSSNMECSDTTQGNIYVHEAPEAHFSYSINGQQVIFISNPLIGSINNYSWDFGDGTSPDSSSDPMHTYTLPGIYNICLFIEDLNGCSDDTCMEIEIGISGINSENAENAIIVYPNPSPAGVFWINLDQYRDLNLVFIVTDVLGAFVSKYEMLENSFNLQEIDLSEQSSGYYLLHIKKGNEVICRKIIIKKE